MASKSKKVKAAQGKKDQRLGYWLIAIPVATFLVKLIIMSNATGGGWLGADGENYLGGVDGIIKDGLYSKEHLLGYWPAGYPILIWLMTKISISHILWVISIIQSAFYGYASYYFTRQIRETKLKPYLFWIALVLAINPTLSLSSLAVGYESPIAACMLMVTGLIVKSQMNSIDRRFWIRVAAVGGYFALASFMQPRWVLTTFVVALIWALAHKNRKHQALILVGVMGIMALAPVALIARNQKAGNGAVISTNLGVTMRLGAGDATDGGYAHKGPDVPCDPVAPATTVTDNDVVKCVIKWYASNPVKSVKLFINKGFFYWSPWSGPIVNGTMARNPWLKIDPLLNIARGSQQGHDLIYGGFGKLISWIWMLSCISLFFIGFFWLRSFKGIYSHLAWLTFTPVVISWVVGMGTIGDHRFRLPTMSLSLILQVVGLYALRHRAQKGSFKVESEG
jgi:hypothetical protein